MTTCCLGKNYSFGLACVSFVNVYEFVCLFFSLLVSSVGFYCVIFITKMVNDAVISIGVGRFRIFFFFWGGGGGGKV